MPLWVLGMHRSGTSFLVRELARHGVGLPPNLLPAAADNPDGFQESADFVAINDALLAAQGCLWDGTWHLSHGVDRPATAAGVQREARRLIHGWCAGPPPPLQPSCGVPAPPRPLLALKDPRLCRTLPLWQSILGAGWLRFGVAISRHPFAVVQSIAYRDDMHPLKALALWLRHNLELLQPGGGNAGRPAWPLLSFERLISHPAAELEPCLQHWRDQGLQLIPPAPHDPGQRLRQRPALPERLEGVEPALQQLALRFHQALEQAPSLAAVDPAICAEVQAVLDGSAVLSQNLLAIEALRRHRLGLALASERRGQAHPALLLGEADLQRLERRPLAPAPPPALVELRGVCVDLRGPQQRRSLQRLALGQGQRPAAPRPLALDHLDLRIDPGERLALLGHNGSGKTTLLRLLGGIYTPTAGALRRNGPPLAPIIDQSLGYSLELTGLQLARYSHRLHHHGGGPGWEAYITAIEAFTELGAALATPIKSWSLGMRTRLTYALITFRQVQGLALDEGLGAGDQWFQRKCKAHLDGFIEAAGTLVLASHSIDLLQRYCSRALILDQGRIRYDGSLYRALQLYQALV